MVNQCFSQKGIQVSYGRPLLGKIHVHPYKQLSAAAALHKFTFLVAQCLSVAKAVLLSLLRNHPKVTSNAETLQNFFTFKHRLTSAVSRCLKAAISIKCKSRLNCVNLRHLRVAISLHNAVDRLTQCNIKTASALSELKIFIAFF